MANTNLRPVIMSGFGPPALACIRSWGRKGLNPFMINIHNPGEAAAASKYLSGSCILPRNQLYTAEGLDIIVHFLGDCKATGLFCIDEKVAVWLNDNKEKLPKYTASCLPTNDMIQRSLPKNRQIKVAENVGMDILPTYFLNSVEDVAGSIPAEHFPLCLRPSEADKITPQFKVHNVQSVDELKQFLDQLIIDAPVIGQPFMNLPNLVVHGTRTVKGETLGLQGFLVERKFQGVTLTIMPLTLKDDLLLQCKAFTENLELCGNYHFEFLHDTKSDKQYFLEFNHRFGGTTAKVYACGYDEPAYALQAYGMDVESSGTLSNYTASNIKALVKSCLYAMADKLTPLDYPVESKFNRVYFSVKSLFYCRDEVFARDDLKGTMAMYLGK